ncbi:MAG: glycosyltransferase [Syntrophobacteraceae bacterium]|jgi:glycosyltransferase involved in cell wall biosynthesis|nr:glycosyltransferase [Syntrophobacteraceae bacterium]
MILKGYPRISESFISSEILLLETLGIPIRIFSIRQPREDFSHRHVENIRADVTYLPEYVIPHWRTLLRTNGALWRRLGSHYPRCFLDAISRSWERRGLATLRHFLQAGHLAAVKLLDSDVTHLHAHFCHTPTSVALFASELTGLPFSFTAHAKDIYTSEAVQLARKIARARFVVTCTRHNADYLARIARKSGASTPIHTIYHGIDLDFFSFGTDAPCQGPRRILSVGRLVAKKGYDDLLRALAILDRDGLDFELIHIGSGELEGELRQLTGRLNLNHRVRLLGTLAHDEVLAHYRRAHCVALACKVAENGDRDGIPNVLIEAMAVGVPVVSTRVSAIPELVEDGVTGALVDPGRPEAMARAIARVLAQTEGVGPILARAREKVEREFDQKRCIKSLFELFTAALKLP